MASRKRSAEQDSFDEDARLADSATLEDEQSAADLKDDESDAEDTEALIDEADEDDAESEAEEDTKTTVVRRNRLAAPVRKAKPTPKAKAKKHKEEVKRTSPALFVRQSVGELKQVRWPSAQVVRQYFAVVLVFVLFIMTFVAGLDWLFGWLLMKALGGA